MQIRLTYGKRSSRLGVKPGSTVAQALEKVGIGRETVVVRRSGVIIPLEEKLKPGDRLEAIRIVSGG